jgi:hypothetical protein
MPKEYCVKCGRLNVFEGIRPQFCGGCGQPFNRTAVPLSNSKLGGANGFRQKSADLQDDDGDEMDQIPPLEALEGTVDYQAGPKFAKFGEVIGTQPDADVRSRPA